ncbi:hypothetical protein BJV74DRAFT_54761 [Russula compacta]|nr:hypothetical protein BJV74DRAFT_54761 [Russula compacta]
MSILNGVVAMNLDSTGYEEPSTPLRDPASSPVVHIQWQNSQSACAAMEELRVASSIPRHPPKPLTFDFELPTSAGPSSSSPDPFAPSRTRSRSVRSRALGRIQSHSQNDIIAIPTADASKFLDMLGRASARVDENSRKRMKAREFELRTGRERARVQRSSIKGKDRMCATTMVTRSMNELGDHANLVQDARDHAGVHYSSLPIMQSKDPASQHSSATQEADKDDVDMRIDAGVDGPAPVDEEDADPRLSAYPRNGSRTQRRHVPSRHANTSARHPKKRIEPPSPTPVRSVPIELRPVPAPPPHKPAANHTSTLSKPTQGRPQPQPSARLPTSTGSHSQHPAPAPTRPPPAAAIDRLSSKGDDGSAAPMTTHGSQSLPWQRTTTSALPPSQQAHASRRALGMRRSVSSRSSSNTSHSAAVKKPFRPPLRGPHQHPHPHLGSPLLLPPRMNPSGPNSGKRRRVPGQILTPASISHLTLTPRRWKRR